MNLNTNELLEALHAHYIRPDDRIAWGGAGAVFMTEVTAPNSNRRIDALHIGLWSSRGAGRIDAHELKVSRADWLRELNSPAKAESWWPYCSRFWAVAPSTEIVRPEEVPDGWGLMVPGSRGRRFKVIAKPEEREPKLTIELLITLLKSTETVRTNTLRQQNLKLREENRKKIEEIRKGQLPLADPDTQRRLQLMEQFEQDLGIKIGSDSWDKQIPPHVAGRAIAEFVQNEAAAETTMKRLAWQCNSLDNLVGVLGEVVQDIRKIQFEKSENVRLEPIMQQDETGEDDRE